MPLTAEVSETELPPPLPSTMFRPPPVARVKKSRPRPPRKMSVPTPPVKLPPPVNPLASTNVPEALPSTEMLSPSPCRTNSVAPASSSTLKVTFCAPVLVTVKLSLTDAVLP